MPPRPEQENAFVVELEKMGETRARYLFENNQISPPFMRVTAAWLAEKDKEAEARREASNAEQMEIARRASAAAERAATAAEVQAAEARRANTRATIALAIAIISIIVSATGIWLPLWEAHK